MDLMNRGATRPAQPAPAPAGVHGPVGAKSKRSKKNLMKLMSGVILICVAVLVAAVAALTFLGPDKENGYVEKDKFQAVFLNGGQVYFGRIKALNSKYLRMQDIYYLQVNQQVQPDTANKATGNDVSLVKLGCELHGPTDEMVINRDQIMFWENLKTDGQVAKAVEEYVKQNPDGQKCTTSGSTGQATPTAAPAAN
jgi:hypothetical protein